MLFYQLLSIFLSLYSGLERVLQVLGADMGKTLLVLLHAVWEDPCNAAEVLAISDGDTLTVIEDNRRIKVRVACIDAPKVSQSPYGKAARQALKSLLPVNRF